MTPLTLTLALVLVSALMSAAALASLPWEELARVEREPTPADRARARWEREDAEDAARLERARARFAAECAADSARLERMHAALERIRA